MAKKIFLSFLLILTLSAVISYHRTSDIKRITLKLSQKKDLADKILVYRVYLLGVLPAAEAKFYPPKQEMLNSKMVLHLRAEAAPLKFFSRFFKGSVLLDSYIDPATGNPVLFKQSAVLPGKEDQLKEVLYDQALHIATLSGERRTIMPDTQDPISLIYNIRHFDQSRLKDIKMYLNTKHKNYLFSGSSVPKKITVSGREYDLILLKATVKRSDKNPYHQTSLDITLLKNEENIPVLIKIFASGFLIKARLSEIR